MTDRINQIRVAVELYKTMPCGPTRQRMIEDFDYLLETVDKCLAMLNKYESDMYRRQQELERRLARIEQQQGQDEVDWLRVCGQWKGVEDDRSGCY
jgi:hypothetical protein